jgi:2-polyprenyl-6-methoxyphenol hydroxylase-like FAD-dependent oxidoreductase
VRQPAVIVAGAGPVGLTAALALAQRDVAVLVLEAEPGLGRESRASTFHPPTLELLDALGLTEEMLQLGYIAPTFQYRDRREGPIVELDLSVLAADTRFPFRLQLEQRILAQLALERLRGHPRAQVRFGHRVLSAQTEGDGAVVEVQAPEGTRSLRAPWVLAADGAHSAIRRSLGIAFEGKTYPERYLVVTVNADLEAELPGIAPINYVFDPDAWFVVLRTQDRWRVLFPVDPSEDEREAVSAERVAERLRLVGARSETLAIEHTTLYHVHQRVAERFRDGRVVLIGDAAHINNPLGGMGMNSGIQDACLVAAPLAEVCHGRGDLAALDACLESRRRFCLEHVLANSDQNAAMIAERDPEARRRRRDQLRALAADRAAMREHLLRTSMLAALAQAAPAPEAH